jgi:DNA-binding beta-propeller fold protein YncE
MQHIRVFQSRLILAVAISGMAVFPGALPAQQKPATSPSPTVRRMRIQTNTQMLPTGAAITPTAAAGAQLEFLRPGVPGHPDAAVGDAVSTAPSPDGKTMLILTSGYNLWYDAAGHSDEAASTEWVFVFDISGKAPKQVQALPVPNAFGGIAWHPGGEEFYVAGGVDDSVHTFDAKRGRWEESGKPIPLGHAHGLGVKIKPMAAGVGITADGKQLIVANFESDSITVVDLAERKIAGELDLRPGKNDSAQGGKAGGEFPYWVEVRGNDRAYVSSVRDREVVIADLAEKPTVLARIALKGQPNKMALNRAQTKLYVAEDNSDTLAVIDTASNQLLDELAATAPAEMVSRLGGFRGSSPNSVLLSPDERTAYVTLGGANALAVVRLSGEGRAVEVAGLIPTGWYPTSASLNRDGTMLYVTNGKSETGPNLGGCRNTTSIDRDALDKCRAQNKYILQLVRAQLLSLPVPAASQLSALTQRVEENNRWPEIAASAAAAGTMHALRGKIQHVIYIIKENRSYDEVLGDLEKGNGDPSLTILPEPLSPNHHQLARQFVTLDNFMASGEVSGDGWNWSTSARATDATEKSIRVNYGSRGLSYDFEGSNRGVNVGLAGLEARRESDPRVPDDPDLLPGAVDFLAPDGPGGAQGAGYLWDAVLRAGLTLRNYGAYIDTTRTDSRAGDPGNIALMRDPHAQGVAVAFPAKPALVNRTDPYYTGFTLRLPDFWREKEWEREFDDYVAQNNLPSLEIIRLPNDHFGDFAGGMDGVNTVETQMGDNDYGLGRIVEKVADSPYAKDTVIFSVEDDAQNGPDHMDAHRTVAYVAGAYVKQGAVVSTRYTTVSMLRTIEELLGTGRMGLNDAAAAPMADVFTMDYKPWSYAARVPVVLRTTQLPLPPAASSAGEDKTADPAHAHPRHTVAWWAAHSRGQNFSVEDDLDTDRFNRALWLGLAPKGAPFPARPVTGADLREDREQLLENYRKQHEASSAPSSNPQH